MTKLYRRLGGWYPFAFLAVELQSALVIVAGTLALFTFYFEGDWGEYAAVLAIALVLTEAAIVATLVRIQPLLRPLRRWIDGERDQESTDRAWSAAVSLPLHLDQARPADAGARHGDPDLCRRASSSSTSAG